MARLPAGVDEVVFDDLERDYGDDKVVVFAGAGVSAGARLPTWKGLAIELADRMRQLRKPADDIDDLTDLLQQNNLVNAMSAARRSLGPEFDRLLKKRLDDADHDVPPVATAIADLAPRLAGVVTTNLDRLLERALGGAWPPILTPVADLLQRKRYIFKPHGTIDDADSWVFTREEYDRATFGSQALQDLFEAVYRARTLLFVGASLADDDFGITLGKVRALAGRNPPTHYAILPDPVRPTRRELLEKAGIRLLIYRNDSGTHDEVVQILQALSGKAAPPAKSPGPAAAPPHAPSPSPPPAPSPSRAAPVDLFLSAAPPDEKMRDRLSGQLQPLADAGRIRLRHEGHVLPGMDTKTTVERFIDAARIVLLLVSADYLASTKHMAQATRALGAAPRGVVVVPVIVRASGWDLAPFASQKPLPPDGRPIASRSDIDAALLEVVQGVRAILDSLP